MDNVDCIVFSSSVGDDGLLIFSEWVEEEVSSKDTSFLVFVFLLFRAFCVTISRGALFYNVECLLL